MLIVAIFTLNAVYGQAPKTIVVEHFTNSECSICATKNPGFYGNLATQPGILHLAIHPSSPYDYCLLNQNNVAENDDRTNYYGIYGGTPRLVIQGSVVSAGANFSDPAIFSPFTGQTSPAAISIKQTIFNDNYVKNEITIKTVEAHDLGELKLFVALAEDTVFYTGGNGEDQHYDVFRKSLTATTGNSIFLPEMVGDSISIFTESPLDINWENNRLFTIAILQESDTKSVVQSASESTFSDSTIVVNAITSDLKYNEILITPNPVNGNNIRINFEEEAFAELSICDISGRVYKSTSIKSGELINVEILPAGYYFIIVTSLSKINQASFIKLN